MKNKLCIVFIWCKLLLFLTPAFADDYYVAPTAKGTGNGSSKENAANLTTLQTYLSSFSRNTSSELNVYFLEGTYIPPTSAFTFGSSSAGITVHFQPLNPAEEVIIQGGSGSYNFMTFYAGSSGNGSLHVIFSDIIFEEFRKTGDGRLFQLRGYNHITLENVIVRNSTFNNNILYFSEGSNNTMDLLNSSFEKNTCSYLFYSYQGSTNYFTNLIGCKFIENTSNNSLLMFHNYNRNSYLKVEDCHFTRNIINSTGTHAIIWIEDNPGHITRCTFDNHAFRNNSQNVIRIPGTHFSNPIIENLVYNNTLSNNTNITQAINAQVRLGGIINNTLYNSGNINAFAAIPILNNLVVGGAITGTATNISRNIFSNAYYATGTSNPQPISNLNSFVLPLEEYESGKPPVHPLVISNSNPIFFKGGRKSDLGDYGSLLTYDQRGEERPVRISLGSWDHPIFDTANGKYVIIYDSKIGFEPSYELDLSDNIDGYPPFATADNIQYTIINSPENGEVSPTNSRLVYFVPKTDEEGLPAVGISGKGADMTYRVSYSRDGIEYSADITMTIYIYDYRLPLGIVDETMIRCYREMNEVQFNSRYKFISSAIGNNNTTIGNITGFPNTPGTNTSNDYKYNGFSIPLVGDLDGDGKPEIVAIGMRRGRYDLAQYGDYLCILNGQTGKEIVRYQFPFSDWSLYRGGHHSAPSSIVLVDADRNGKAEIIVAVGGAGNSGYNYRLLCYEVNDNTFLDREGGSDAGNSNKLTLKWQSSSYVTPNEAWAYAPTPQVVDIDGDGVPEILVCHKIYSALDGTELLTLDQNYMGRDPNSRVGDQYMTFPYIYDVDMDGKYDIAAGGKLYYDIDLKNKTYKTKQAPNNIGDGHTAVADINADGIPDIIVSRNSDLNNHYLYVWDPGFFIKEGNEIKRVDNAPQLMASRRSYQSNYYDGSHSYIYVGDIDGREDSYGKRHPEISILGGRWFSGTLPVPVHPNVANLNGGKPFPLSSNGYLSYEGGSGSNHQIGLGALLSYTWDETATNVNERLKVSFILKHNDSSINTGFTLFDFNNDGVRQICYRDEFRLRIISATEPYYDAFHEGDMSTSVLSYTGFEYPVIADIDGDGSADLIVMGQNLNRTTAFGFVYAVESTIGDFAPAPKVWNQFMYDPLKINEDLTTPLVNRHPLSDDLAFVKEKDASTGKKTYIYNNTISQVVVSAEFNGVLKPIVKIPDAGIEGRIDTQNSQIIMYITNTGDATLNAQTPIRFYLEELGAGNICTNLGGGPAISVIGGDVFPGDTLMITQALLPDELYENYIIRVNDSSTSTHYYEDISKQEDYYDCNWANNTIEVGTFVARNDAATVIQFGEVVIDVLANDVLPEDFDGLLKENMFVEHPAVGSWSIVNNKLRYTAPGSANGEIIKFRYALQQDTKIKYADVYIYILESCSYGFSVCAGSNYQVCLHEYPQGIRFEWYEDKEGEIYLGEEAPSLTNLNSDHTLYVKPIFGDVTDVTYDGHRKIDFPLGELTISVVPSHTGTITAKWTGQADTNWYNPANWVQVMDNGKNIPVSWTPNSCTHVIISKDATYYPILTSPSECVNITMEDRAMLAGIHHLTYADASVEIRLRPTERDRFVMWSAPLKNMYTGDYHFTGSNDWPNWGDVYMNYFQAENPDFSGSVAKANVLTATFGTPNEPLTIAKPFAIKVINLDSNSTFSFPKTTSSYKGDDNKDYSTSRDGSGSKFIVDALMDPTGAFDMRVNDRKGYSMIHVSNPFMAYLDAQLFVDANSGKIEGGYKLWNGQVDDNFITYVKANESDPHNHFITDASQLEKIEGGLIAPLQSFFVMKARDTDSIGTLRISAEMTTTLHPDDPVYQLRTGENQEWYVMRITAEQDGFSNSTILHYDPAAVQSYLPGEDSRKLFNTQSPLAVYTLSPSLDALAVYSSGDFSQDVKMGLRLKKAEKVKLNFSGMKYFQHEVYLIDHEDNDKVYDLSVTPELTFDIDEYSTGNYIELTNRFSLHFNYAPTGTAVIPEDGMRVSSRSGFLYIDANGSEINRLRVYNLQGQLISAPAKKDAQFKIQVTPNQFYLVKGEVHGKIQIVKVIAR